ncbi:hypothetical protein ABT158_41490 [Nonomuraea sp. NPDC001636]|uniref:hypothetical protein n=1 Tax=Nonomuraea sp. NPDC001636 TaxID=3154391 RepID=UPI0033314938
MPGRARAVAVTARTASGTVTMIRRRAESVPALRCRTHQARARAGRAIRSVGSARTREGPATRLQPWEARSAPVSVVFMNVNSRPVRTVDARSARRPRSRAIRAGATTSPARSLSLPVRRPGQSGLKRWSLSRSRMTPVMVTG